MNTPDITAVRRRIFFGLCRQLGISDDEQRAMAVSYIPDGHPLKWDLNTGEVSRKAIFVDYKIFNSIAEHLNSMVRNRRRGHVRMDGSVGAKNATKSQIDYAIDLAVKIGWADKGDENLRFRLERFASRQLNRSSEYIVPRSFWSTKDALKIIDALKSMNERGYRGGPDV